MAAQESKPDLPAADVETQNAQNAPYSVFTPTEKRIIVAIVSYAAWFSALSSFIYYPAIHQLAQTFAVSVSQINLTVTSYLAVATIAPTLVGDAADLLGRRPIYGMALSLYTMVNVAIVLEDSYKALLGLRVMQALAISGNFSIAYGVIADVASPAERGTYVSMVSFAITCAPSIGPMLGGSLSYAAGWQWIFWFLCIAAASCLSIMAFCLPETSRNVVGNGSIKPSKYLRLPFPNIMRHWANSDELAHVKWRTPNPLRSLKLIARIDNTVIIFAAGLLYVIYTCINTSLSVLLIEVYNLNEWQAGLTYLPFGLGGAVSTFFTGPLINKAYQDFRSKKGLTTDRIAGDDLDNFSIERARLRIVWVPMALTTCSVIAFGWALEYRWHIAICLCLQFIIGLFMQLDFSIYNTLLVDKNYRTPAAAQASSNIVRCSLAAIAVSFLQDFMKVAGIGWAFTFLGGLCLITTGLFAVDFFFGTSWRQKRLSS